MKQGYNGSEIDWSEFPSPKDFKTQIDWALTLTEWRNANRISQTRLAKELGLSQGLISALETCREPMGEIKKEYFLELKTNGPEAAKAKRKELLIQKIMG